MMTTAMMIDDDDGDDDGEVPMCFMYFQPAPEISDKCHMMS